MLGKKETGALRWAYTCVLRTGARMHDMHSEDGNLISARCMLIMEPRGSRERKLRNKRGRRRNRKRRRKKMMARKGGKEGGERTWARI